MQVVQLRGLPVNFLILLLLQALHMDLLNLLKLLVPILILFLVLVLVL
jgi:hypothetical protein